ncbi:phosphatidylethanolamine-binding protein [Scheffersomyces coipomensis]|uniref:phosphatidylethanolamine-binding protein n=1 Tax=Scheffersomyces coipomensis TaxID=1788519 RepID=UPI00315DA298
MFSRNSIQLIRNSLLKSSPKSILSPHYSYRQSNQLFQSKMPLITISQSLDESYSKHKIIPDVIDEFTTQGLLTIAYNDQDQVALGNTLNVLKTQNKPKIQFTLNSPTVDGQFEPIKNNDKFILVLTDPDAPSNSDHKWSEYAHWIITDLKLNDSSSSSSSSTESNNDISHILDYSKGKEILSYSGPAPPAKTGKHRYVYLFYKQDPDVTNFQIPNDRPNWGTGIPSSGVRDWIKKNAPKSKLLSVNFFYAQHEDN